jgi:hypothetical protein
MGYGALGATGTGFLVPIFEYVFLSKKPCVGSSNIQGCLLKGQSISQISLPSEAATSNPNNRTMTMILRAIISFYDIMNLARIVECMAMACILGAKE